jgi:hypothetical protein
VVVEAGLGAGSIIDLLWIMEVMVQVEGMSLGIIIAIKANRWIVIITCVRATTIVQVLVQDDRGLYQRTVGSRRHIPTRHFPNHHLQEALSQLVRTALKCLI